MRIAVETSGLAEFTKRVKKFDATLVKEFKKARSDLTKKVRRWQKLRAQSVGGVAVKAAKSIKIFNTAKASGVKLSPNPPPEHYTHGAEFGSKAHRQFKAHNPEGYFFHPVPKEREAEITGEIVEFMERFAQGVGR